MTKHAWHLWAEHGWLSFFMDENVYSDLLSDMTRFSTKTPWVPNRSRMGVTIQMARRGPARVRVPVPVQPPDERPSVRAKVKDAKRKRPPDRVGPFSHSEFRVLRELAHGWSVPEVAVRLFITENTVKTHAKRLRERIKARNTAHAVGLAVKNGWLDLDDD